MSRNYQQDPASFDYLRPFMSSTDRAIHDEMCGREVDSPFDKRQKEQPKGTNE